MLKDALTQASVLYYLSFTMRFTLQTDASTVGRGAVLEQEGYMILTQCIIIEWERLAVLLAFKYNVRLLEQPFIILHTMSHSNGFLLRQIVYMGSCSADQILKQMPMQMICGLYMYMYVPAIQLHVEPSKKWLIVSVLPH